jgi:membrane protein implicated in regulation of membrane protease activity
MNHKAVWVDLFQALLAFAALGFFFWSLRRRIVGLEGVVLEEKEPGPYVLITIGGQKWRAIAADGAQLQPGERVVVLRLQGLQLAVVDRAPLHVGDDPPKVRDLPIFYE